MNKEQFTKKLITSIENSIFGELKDSAVRTWYIQRKYEGSGINVQDVYRRIVNYQVAKYGEQLTFSLYIPRRKEEVKKENSKARMRRYYWRNRDERDN